MITSTVETTRFYTGVTLTYNDASIGWLLQQSEISQDSSTEMRAVAAAGIVRAVLDVPVRERNKSHSEAIAWATHLLFKTLEDDPQPFESNPYIQALPNVSSVLDSVTVTATRANHPLQMAEIICGFGDDYPGILVLGLGHGGIIAAADTFLTMKREDKAFYPIRFSRKKHGDKVPVLSEQEIDMLGDLSVDKMIVVFDEDRGMVHPTTMQAAVQYFAKMFGANVYGATPTLGRHPSTFWPQIIDCAGNVLYDKMCPRP